MWKFFLGQAAFMAMIILPQREQNIDFTAFSP
jgi:hypothetical protein